MFWKSKRQEGPIRPDPFTLPRSYASFRLGRLPWEGLEKSLAASSAELPNELWPGVTVLGGFKVDYKPKVVWVVGETEVASRSYADMPCLDAHVFLPELPLAVSLEERLERALPALREVYRRALPACIEANACDICSVVATLLKKSSSLGDGWAEFWPQLAKSKFILGFSGERYSPEELALHRGQIFLVNDTTPEETVRRGRSASVLCLAKFSGADALLKHYGIPWEVDLKGLKELAAKAGPIVGQKARDSAVEIFFERAKFQDGRLTLVAGKPGGHLVIDYARQTVRGPRSEEGEEAEIAFSEILDVGIDEECHQMDSRYLTKFFLRIATKRLALTYQVHFSDTFGVYEGMGEDSRRDEWAKLVLHALPGTLTTNIRIACPQYILSEPLDRLFQDVPPGRKR